MSRISSVLSQAPEDIMKRFSTFGRGTNHHPDLNDREKLTKQLHKHKHYRPKDHEENFKWLDYQYERKHSAMARTTTKMPKEESWEDLTVNNNVKWWQVDMSWDNLMYGQGPPRRPNPFPNSHRKNSLE